jgi:hypothetical protein
MNKFIFISDKKEKNLSEKILQKFLNYDSFNLLSGTQAEEVIKKETGSFLLLDIKQPANLDKMNRLSLGTTKGLRVTVFRMKPLTAAIFNFLIPLDIIELLFSRHSHIQSEDTSLNSSPSLQVK